MQLILLAPGEHLSAPVAHKPIAVLDGFHMVQKFLAGVEQLSAIQTNGARVLVHGLVVRVQRPFLHERFGAVLTLQHDRFQLGPMGRGHVYGQSLTAVARQTARSTTVPQMAVDVQLIVPTIYKRLLAVMAFVVLGHRRNAGMVTGEFDVSIRCLDFGTLGPHDSEHIINSIRFVCISTGLLCPFLNDT